MRHLLLVIVSLAFAVGCTERRYDGIGGMVQPDMPTFVRDVTPYEPFEYHKDDERLLEMQLFEGEWAVAKLHVFASWSPEASPEGDHPLTPDSRVVVLGRLATPAEIASLGNGTPLSAGRGGGGVPGLDRERPPEHTRGQRELGHVLQVQHYLPAWR